MITKVLKLICFTFLPMSTQALELQPESSSPTLKESLLEAQNLIPQPIKEALGALKIKVLSGKAKDFQSLSFTSCEANPPTDKNLYRFSDFQDWGAVIPVKPRVLYLNPSLMTELEAGYDPGFTTCRHRSSYEYALGAVLYAVFSLYDKTRFTPEEYKLHRQCEVMGPQERAMEPSCARLEHKHQRISDSAKFQQLSMDMGESVTEARRQEVRRLVDPLLETSTNSLFSRHLENAILSANYSCVFPGLSAYFEDTFKVHTKPCFTPEPTEIRFTESSVRLDPDDIASVDLMVVDPGEDFFSLWGHAMLYLRTHSGKDWIVSYYAKPDEEMSIIGGLFGDYPAHAFLYRAEERIQNYIGSEKRQGISAWPIKLNKSQKKVLIMHAADSIRNQQRSWSHLFNNCATNLLDLLKSVFDERAFLDLNLSKPMTLINELDQLGFLGEMYRIEAN